MYGDKTQCLCGVVNCDCAVRHGRMKQDMAEAQEAKVQARVDDLADRLRKALSPFIGEAQITPVLLDRVRTTLIDIMPSSSQRSAGAWREAGYILPPKIENFTMLTLGIGPAKEDPALRDRIVVSLIFMGIDGYGNDIEVPAQSAMPLLFGFEMDSPPDPQPSTRNRPL